MQRLSISEGGGSLWIDEDPQGEFVRAADAQAQTAEFLAWLDGELQEGTCPEFLAAIRKVREKFVEMTDAE